MKKEKKVLYFFCYAMYPEIGGILLFIVIDESAVKVN